MSKNLLNTKAILICLFSVLFVMNTKAEDLDRYNKRINQYQDLWTSLMPTYTKVQYAGGMGLVSCGFGWSYGNKDYDDFSRRLRLLRHMYDKCGYKYAPYFFEYIE